MKKNLLTSLFFLFSGMSVIFAQEYHPLLENPTWIVYKYYSGQVTGSPNKFIENPVIAEMNGITYKRFVDPYMNTGNNNDSYVYLREDVSQKKVFSLVGGSEKLIYDFSLENGDSFTQGQQTYTATVNDTLISGVTRKKITLQLNGTVETNFRQTWIEGIGGTSHPLVPYYNVQSYLMTPIRRNWTHLKCFYNNDEHLYGEANCQALLETDDQNTVIAAISVYPNPAVSEINIHYNTGFQNLTLKIFNSIGQLVREADNKNGQLITLDLEKLSGGFYTIQVIEAGALLETKKILVN